MRDESGMDGVTVSDGTRKLKPAVQVITDKLQPHRAAKMKR